MQVKLLLLPFVIISSSTMKVEAQPNPHNNVNVENIIKAVSSCFLSSVFNYKNFIGHYTPVVGTAWTATDFALCVRNKLNREEDINFWEETIRDMAINNLFTYGITSPVTSNWGKSFWVPSNFKSDEIMLVGRTAKANLFLLKQWLMERFNSRSNNHNENN